MSLGEVVSRCRNYVHGNAQRMGLFRADHPPRPDLTANSFPWLPKNKNIRSTPYVEAADLILGGRWTVFALEQ
ncbi:MAG: hypothetical protein OEU36_22995, partial [Gammaproteobacteria bacterium]|nr:hypothetical protein [Gammaproteobacteria bacterium]